MLTFQYLSISANSIIYLCTQTKYRHHLQNIHPDHWENTCFHVKYEIMHPGAIIFQNSHFASVILYVPDFNSTEHMKPYTTQTMFNPLNEILMKMTVYFYHLTILIIIVMKQWQKVSHNTFSWLEVSVNRLLCLFSPIYFLFFCAVNCLLPLEYIIALHPYFILVSSILLIYLYIK